ncbi:hypothetical protein AFK68_27130 [Hydrocoleum sp. CS-953]|uniref:hypothetical protein n=1 Tax=Hydrocoleum sp. CS-953 TaxID=1671698 RepID=UPI000B9AE61F|nr:hypothetical protein [Hydrocoleum sp. CS-953]OZH52005.1 hypothetical protein AFK68_27130 [Hydrocoleum sp. CS-953]
MNNKLDSLSVGLLITINITMVQGVEIQTNKFNHSFSQTEKTIIQQPKNYQKNEQPPIPQKDGTSR